MVKWQSPPFSPAHAGCVTSTSCAHAASKSPERYPAACTQGWFLFRRTVTATRSPAPESDTTSPTLDARSAALAPSRVRTPFSAASRFP